MKIIATIILIALLFAGCAPVPVQDHSSAVPEYREPPVVQGVLFGVSGEPKNADECFLRYEIIYPEDIRPIELALELETEMKREDGSWLGVSWIEGIREQLPSDDAVFRPGGGGLLHYIHMQESLLACDQMRFRVIVHACEPAPCPPLAIDDRADLFTTLLDDRSAR